MGISYREASEEYKKSKKKIVDGYDDAPHRKKKKKKQNKRSDHKHHYVPCIFYLEDRDTSILFPETGSVCDICGRPDDIHFIFSVSKREEVVSNFKKKHPDYIEIILPKDFDFWKAKTIPLDCKV